jgi:hypothetical protein
MHRFSRFLPLFLATFLFCVGCGGKLSYDDIIITGVESSKAGEGGVVTLFGHGFTSAPALVVMLIGPDGSETPLEVSELGVLGEGAEAEYIKVLLPAGMAAGSYRFFVYLPEGDIVSNEIVIDLVP